MYALHFGLTERPFSLAPDPRYLFLSDGHREALAHLLFGLREGGNFVQLTGEVGTGKTTVCRSLLDQLPPEVDVAMIFNPRLTSVELVASVCDELRVPYPPGTTSLKVLVDALSRALVDAHARGRRTVLIVDEAQNLSMEVLEDLRLLTNLETTRDKMLQVILIGQPELAALLRRPQLRQLAQRVTARYHLRPFTFEEACAYIRHRLTVAGQRKSLFTPGALRVAHRRSGGVPRLINSVCDRALLGAYAGGRKRVTARIMRQAAAEVLGGTAQRRWVPAAIAAGVVAVLAVAALAFGPWRVMGAAARWMGGARPVAAVTTPAPPPPPAASTAPTVALPPPVEASPPSLTVLLAASGADDERTAAFAALYARWGVADSASAGALGCEYARQVGLRCVRRAGTWNALRRLDLPAVLTLVAPDGARHYAGVTSLGTTTATLTLGERTLTLPLTEVERYWDGEFVALWRGPTARTVALRPGMGGRDIAWLRQRLAHLDGAPAADGTDLVYDEELRRRVVAFQRANALAPDGIAGEETLLRLATMARESSAPLLTSGRP